MGNGHDKKYKTERLLAMSLKCDVTGSTDRVAPLPAYMQTDKIKNVCFNVAVKMEKERVEGKKEPKASEAIKEVVEQVKPSKKSKKKNKKAKK